MDVNLAKIMDKYTPDLNDTLAEGLAIVHMKQVEEYIDSIFRSVAKKFPSDLVYDGYVRCTPFEEFAEATRKRSMGGLSRRYLDLARNDTYMVKYYFRFKGEEIVRYLALPYLTSDGYIHISGVKYVISPLSCDKIISVGIKDIFVKLNLSKLTFKSIAVSYLANGCTDTVQLVYAKVYNKSSKNNSRSKKATPYSCMTHYILCRYGLFRLFKEFVGCTPIVMDIRDVDYKVYNPDEYVVCQSVGVKPSRGYKGNYVANTIALIFKKDEYTNTCRSHVAGFYYIIDHWPERVEVSDLGNEDEVRKWKHLLGELIWGDSASIGRLETDAEEHLQSIDNYVDDIMYSKFEDIGMKVENAYELFAIIVENFNDWLVKKNNTVCSMYEKELEVLYYVLTDIVNAINNMFFKITHAYNKVNSKGKPVEVSIKDVKNIMNGTISTKLISKLSSGHAEITTVSTSSDNKAFKTTMMLVPQESTGANMNRKSNNKAKDDPTQNLNSSIAEVCVYSAINKSDPSGHNRLNHYACISANGEIKRNPKFIELLDDVQQYLDRAI